MNVFRVVSALSFAAILGCGASNTDLTDDARRAEVEEMFQKEAAKFDVPVISIADAKTASDVVIVDVRPPNEREISMIPGAVSSEEYESNPEEYGDKRVATYCTIGYRSGQYAELLREKGVDALNLEGSILGWVHAGEPVVDENGEPIKRIHVYGDRWDLAPRTYETVK